METAVALCRLAQERQPSPGGAGRPGFPSRLTQQALATALHGMSEPLGSTTSFLLSPWKPAYGEGRAGRGTPLAGASSPHCPTLHSHFPMSLGSCFSGPAFLPCLLAPGARQPQPPTGTSQHFRFPHGDSCLTPLPSEGQPQPRRSPALLGNLAFPAPALPTDGSLNANHARPLPHKRVT